MRIEGRVEIISQDCVFGWATISADRVTYVCAKLDDKIIGIDSANIDRPDLQSLAERGTITAKAFLLVFDRELSSEEMARVTVHILGSEGTLETTARVVRDRYPALRIFVLGSPRSGTSELGSTLSNTLGLRWLGEGHAADRFATAAKALTPTPEDTHALVRFMKDQQYSSLIVKALKRDYFFSHGSASFIDKTPGIPMIRAAPFLAECFPEAKFIYLRRNGISNVLSRMVKFGGSFESNCADWAAAISAWVEVRDTLPSYLEIAQEDMLENPNDVALKIANYVGLPDSAEAIGKSLSTGKTERTGAGINRKTLASTGWSAKEIESFSRICGNSMRILGYPIE